MASGESGNFLMIFRNNQLFAGHQMMNEMTQTRLSFFDSNSHGRSLPA
jgi:hypothetical protein